MNEEYKTFINVAGAGACIIGVTYGLARYSYGLFLPYFQNSLQLNMIWLGFIGSSSYIGYLFATLLGSILSGKFGPRIPILVGGVCAATGMFIVSMADTKWILLLGITLAGMSPGFAYPPFSDIVVLKIKQTMRETAFAIINAGTSLGVLIAIPLALIAGSEWQISWLFFGIIALLVTVWNYSMAPTETIARQRDHVTIFKKLTWLFNKNSSRVFSYTILLGIFTSVLWTYGVDYIEHRNVTVTFFGICMKSGVFTKIFWSCIGLSGFSGVIAGVFVLKYGMRAATQSTQLLIACATLILPLFSSNSYLLIISSLLFGTAFMIGTAYIGIWAINIFYERPSAGMGSVFLILSIGQFIGPVIFGTIIEHFSYNLIFYIAGFGAVLASFIKPRQNIFKMTPG